MKRIPPAAWAIQEMIDPVALPPGATIDAYASARNPRRIRYRESRNHPYLRITGLR